jgi:heme/copper-type cytochrome/quinol oxidase subunit 4
MAMIGFLVIVVLTIILFPLVKGSKYKEIERHQAMRRTMSKLREEFHNYGL